MPALLNKKTLNVCGKTQKIESEISVSDSVKIGDNLPNLKDVVFFNTLATITDKNIYMDTYTVRGRLTVSTLYRSEDGVLESFEAIIPFETVGEAPQGENKTLFVGAEVKKCVVSPLRQRRLDIDATLRMTGYVSASDAVSESISVEGVDEVYTDTKEARGTLLKGIASSRQYEFEFNPGPIAPGKILYASGKLSEPTITSGRSAILYNAMLDTDVIYTCEEEDGSLSYHSFSESFPVNQVINTEIGDAYDGFEVKASLRYDNAQFVFGENGIKVLMSVTVFYDAVLLKNVSWPMISDAYSSSKLITVKRGVKTISLVETLGKGALKLSESASVASQDGFVKVACADHRIQYEAKASDGLLSVDGTLAVEALLLKSAGDATQTVRASLPFSWQYDTPLNLSDVILYVSLSSLSCDVADGRLNVEAEISVESSALINSEIEEIEDMTVGDYEAGQDNYTIIKIHYMQPGERLWDIAKANRTSIEKILGDNAIDSEEDVTLYQPLLIN